MGFFKFAYQTAGIVIVAGGAPCPLCIGRVIVLIAAEHIRDAQHDGNDVFGISIFIQPKAEDIHPGQSGIKGGGGDHGSISVQLEAESHIHIQSFSGHVRQLVVDV